MIYIPGGHLIPIPSWLECVLFVLQMVLIAQAGLWLFNKVKWHLKFEAGNEVAGIIFGAIALIYSLILAFVIVAVWDDYNDLNKTIHAETDKLNSILSHTSTLPDNLKVIVGKSISEYCDQVVNQEWQMQAIKSDHPSAIPVLRKELMNIQPQNKIQERIFDVVDDDLSTISDLHRERLSHTHSQMPNLIWQILKAGTVMLILFTYFFQVSSSALQRVYLTFIVVIVSMCMFLVYSLDHPFKRGDGVNDQPYRSVKQEIKGYMPIPAP